MPHHRIVSVKMIFPCLCAPENLPTLSVVNNSRIARSLTILVIGRERRRLGAKSPLSQVFRILFSPELITPLVVLPRMSGAMRQHGPSKIEGQPISFRYRCQI